MPNLNQSSTHYLSISFVGLLILLGYMGFGSKSSTEIQNNIPVMASELSAPFPQVGKMDDMSSGRFKAYKGLSRWTNVYSYKYILCIKYLH